MSRQPDNEAGFHAPVKVDAGIRPAGAAAKPVNDLPNGVLPARGPLRPMPTIETGIARPKVQR